MKAIVTGGAGFIGHHLANALIDMGHEVHVWDNLSTGNVDRLNLDVEFIRLDLTYDVLPDIEADVVFHLAAPTSVQESIENPIKYEQGCYMATKRLLDWALTRTKRPHVLMASTAAIYGEPTDLPVAEDATPNPMSPYASWKLYAERLLQTFNQNLGLPTTALRLFNVYGPGQPSSGSYAPAVARFLQQYEAFKPITVTGDGLQTRDYINVLSVVQAFILAANRSDANIFQIYNVGSGEELTILEIAERFGGEIQHIEPRLEPRRSLSDIKKIKNDLKWLPGDNVLHWIDANR